MIRKELGKEVQRMFGPLGFVVGRAGQQGRRKKEDVMGGMTRQVGNSHMVEWQGVKSPLLPPWIAV